ncbi:MAG: response regulator transcription factor [Planctomycetaceae bacterium]|nr:response regulator transcription factor [Planctomycetaceae bacterium]MCA9111821.1 response regulator transcription factor [Planctomycetaceae bacterium]
MSKSRILLVEDDPSISEILQHNLGREGYEVTAVSDGQTALHRARSLSPDLVILDLMIPVIDGLEVCRQLRSDPRTHEIRVLMLTAKGEETDEVVGFNMGADDYVTKPFRIKPLLERIKAQLRRPPAASDNGDVLACSGIEMNRADHMVTLDGQEVLLTPTEFRLLWSFLRQQGRTFSRHELMDCSRGEDANSLERTIDVHIRSLRKKLGDYASCVETVRGIGYRFRANAAAVAN